MQEYVVAVDAMGGDNAPGAIVEGAINALRLYPSLRVLLFGPKETLQGLTASARDLGERLVIEDAREVVSMHDAPTLAIRQKKDASLTRAMRAVKEGRAQAAVSAGSTGAILAGGILLIGRLEGVERPALAVVYPGRKKPFLLLDCGANTDCQAEYLNKFALMGSVYAQKVMGVKEPDVRLLNIGIEPEKGDRRAKEAYQLMSAQGVYRFGGNIEARDVPAGECDVVVADGFDGNIVVKYTEGLSAALIGMLKEEMTRSLRSKIGALLLKPALRAFKKRMSADEYGGAPLLGVKGTVVKAHGSANAVTVQNAIRQALALLEGDVCGLIGEGVKKLVPSNETGGKDNA